jgi:hypothetical protein
VDAEQAARNLELIRTLMERTCQYELLTARAGLAAGSLASAGALAFFILDPANPTHFALVWAGVFLGSLLATAYGAARRSRERGERMWSRQARAVLLALAPALFCALVLSVLFFAWGCHLWLPGIWMLCYGQGALATSAYAPDPIRWLGVSALILGAMTLCLGPGLAVIMMGIVFGLGHGCLGLALLIAERRRGAIRLHRFVA